MVNERTTSNSRRAAGRLPDNETMASGHDGGQSSLDSTTHSAVFQPVSHPILRSVDPQKVVKFLKERQRYADEVLEKQKEVPSMQVASYKVSIDRTLLESMQFIGKFDDIAPDKDVGELTSEHIEQFIRGIISHQDGADINPTVVQDALRGVRMPMTIADPEARVLEFVNDVFARLEGVGYKDFKESNPEKTIKLLQEHLYPPHLKAAMAEHLEYQQGLKKKLKPYVRLLCKEATIQDKVKIRTSNRNQNKTRDQKGGDTNKGRTSSTKSTSSGRTKPVCLNPACAEKGVRHYIKDCDKATQAEKDCLLKAYIEKRKSFKKVSCSKTSVSETNSTILNATFAGVETRNLCADNGSDINLMPPDLLAALIEKRADIVVKPFKAKRKFGLAAAKSEEKEPLYVVCDREAIVTTELQIRHGKALKLRKLSWYVATHEVNEPLLGRPILEALGLNTKILLEAACDKFEGSVDVDTLLPSEDYSDGSVARILSSGIYHSNAATEDDAEADSAEDHWLDLGEDTEQEIQEAFNTILKQAGENGLSSEGQIRLRGMLQKNRDVFRLRLGPDPPADVEPMKISVKPGYTPHIAKARRYTAEQREFMSSYVGKLADHGFIRPNRDASWAAAPLLVPKPPPAKFRLTFDLRRVNAATIPVAWPMPHIESELLDLAGSTCFACIDFCSGYWQLPLDEKSQQYHSFLTPTGIFKPTRTLQGGNNCMANFQSRVEPCFAELRNSLKAWLDDFILHAKTEKELLNSLETFFEVCVKRRLKISAKKSVLFSKVIRWCGRIIDKDGVTCDPRRLSGLMNTHMPVTAAELSQFVYCLQWMSGSIPDFANRIAPLRAMLEEAYSRSGKRTTKSIHSIRLAQLSWGPVHADAYLELQEQLRNAVKLSHRDPEKTLCVYTDASDTHWAAVVTQCRVKELDKNVEEQRHEPLAFLSAIFNSTQTHWSTFEKEAYAIFQAFDKLDYMFAAENDIHIFSDHRNLLFVYNPTAIEPALGRHILNKVQRWALYLSRFTYTIEHIAGERNVMADIMTRWFAGYRAKQHSIKRITHALMAQDMVGSPQAVDFEWPNADMISKAQEDTISEKPKDSYTEEDGIIQLKGKNWIPDDAVELQMKLLVVAHCGAAGHRGAEATLSALKETFHWRDMAQDCKEFTKCCIHCLTAKGGLKIPRPLSMTLHGSKPNEVIHFDYLYMGPGIDDLKYILVIRDDLSSYLWLCPTKAANAENAATELARWIRVFTVMQYWVSDQAAHFKNQVMMHLAGEHRIQHKFTVAYSPWVNGTVENCMKHIMRACRAIQSELKLGPQDWPLVAGTIMTALNEAPLKRLGTQEDGTYRTPLEVMTGLKPLRTQLEIGGVGSSSSKKANIEQARALQLLNIEDLQKVFDSMHKNVSERVNANRKKQITQHNKKTNLISTRFQVGDFVVVRRAQMKGHKMSFRWVGPRRVTRVLSEVVYEVTGLAGRKTECVHASRLLLYRTRHDGQEVSEDLLKHAKHTETKFDMVDQLLNIGEGDQGILVQVQWLGQPDKCDWTWQPLAELYEDVPERLLEFFNMSRKTKLVAKAKAALGITEN